MAYLEFHPENRRCSLAVGIKIIQDGQDDEDRKHDIQDDEEKVIDLGSPESGFVESLEEEDDEMHS
jgi:hypothetical protein